MARHRDLKRERTWRQHIERQRRSGRTLRDYCSDHELTESAFYRWRRIIAERDGAAGVLAPASTALPAFVPVAVIDAPARRTSSPIDVCLADGRRVRVRSGCDRELLATVLALLEGRSC
jgi:hypothetical protein